MGSGSWYLHALQQILPVLVGLDTRLRGEWPRPRLEGWPSSLGWGLGFNAGT